MSPLDKIIKERLESFEYPVDSSAWLLFDSVVATRPLINFKGALLGGVAVSIVALAAMTLPATLSLEPEKDAPLNAIVEAEETTTSTTDDFKKQDLYSESLSNPETWTKPKAHTIALKPVLSQQKSLKVEEVDTRLVAESPDKAENRANLPTADSESTQEIVQKTVEFEASGIECTLQDIAFSVINPKMDVTYKWRFSDGDSKVGHRVVKSFPTAGEFVAVLEAKYSDGEILKTEKAIEIYSNPRISETYTIRAGEECFEQKVELEIGADQSLAETIVTLEDGPTLSGIRSTASLMPGRHQIEIKAASIHGCLSKKVIDIDVPEGLSFLAPNAFSPNGDNLNETWAPAGLIESGLSFTMHIVDMTGKVVFTSQSRAWDGKSSVDGTVAKTGERFGYQIIIVDDCGTEKEMRGTITVVN